MVGVSFTAAMIGVFFSGNDDAWMMAVSTAG